MIGPMRRLAVVLAVLCAGLCAFLVTQGRSASRAPVQHSCGLTDHQFIQSFVLEIAEVDLYHDDWVHGAGSVQEVSDASFDAAHVMKHSAPTDPTLHLVKHLTSSMFLSYSDAMHKRATGQHAAHDLDQAYTIQTRVQDELRAERVGLARVGCSVRNLLQ
jgi:hypothetical protein